MGFEILCQFFNVKISACCVTAFTSLTIMYVMYSLMYQNSQGPLDGALKQ